MTIHTPARPASDPAEGFRADVLAGLGAPRKALSPKYFYDDEGSRLFDRICELPEYYPTRTELQVLAARAPAIGALAGPGASLVEFGAGSSVKVRLLLDAMEAPAAYMPIDISGPHMRAAAGRLAADYPGLALVPVEADFTRPLVLPPLAAGGRRVGFFPGSTIGNFTPEAAGHFLAHAAQVLGQGAAFVVGFDMVKPLDVLEAAYDDAQGVTAAFNLNLLARINRELGGDFDLSRFRHHAFFNAAQSRIEMHLESRVAQTVRVAGHSFRFAAGETIHTENSCKFTPAAFLALSRAAGWEMQELWTDPAGWFAVTVLARR
ncbi:L-histidine N(alpha)-methyltransferase [Xanthobacter sp. V3C-3]|uniref:L-histidine N(alpha)-methyltransferase n=1 Tax=Xanthobacter lutulentifluminis TaxID=3119935 RepID=UPI00372B7519